jgi:glycerol-3-phosphate dehydrogenase (NAD(P)+)
MSVEEVTASTRQVAEGVKSCLSILELARAHGVDLPITASVVAVVHHGLAPREMGMRLLSRARRPEQD